MKFDFKITTWERVTVPAHLEETVTKAIESGRVTSSNNLHDFLAEEGHEVDTDYSIIPELEEQMTVDENGGCSTIEILNGEGVCTWSNDILSSVK